MKSESQVAFEAWCDAMDAGWNEPCAAKNGDRVSGNCPAKVYLDRQGARIFITREPSGPYFEMFNGDTRTRSVKKACDTHAKIIRATLSIEYILDRKTAEDVDAYHIAWDRERVGRQAFHRRRSGRNTFPYPQDGS